MTAEGHRSSHANTQDDLESRHLGGVEGVFRWSRWMIGTFQISQQSGLKQEAKRAGESSQHSC